MSLSTKYFVTEDENAVTAIPRDGHMLMSFQRGSVFYDSQPSLEADQVLLEVQVPTELLDLSTPVSGQNTLALKIGLDVPFAQNVELPFRAATL